MNPFNIKTLFRELHLQTTICSRTVTKHSHCVSGNCKKVMLCCMFVIFRGPTNSYRIVLNKKYDPLKSYLQTWRECLLTFATHEAILIIDFIVVLSKLIITYKITENNIKILLQIIMSTVQLF